VGYNRLRFAGATTGEQLLILNYIDPRLADAMAANAFRATVTVNDPPAPLTDANNEESVHAAVGDLISVVLPSNPSDGNQWQFIDTGDGVLAQVMNTTFTADPEAANGVGTETLNFLILGAGEQLLILNYIHPQLADAPAASAFRVTVIAGGTDDESAPPPTSADPLAGTSWVGEAINGQPLVADSTITAAFADGQMAGKASFNNYFTSYTVDGSSLSLGMAGSTMMACAESSLMDQEQAFLAALGQVTGFTIDGDTLTLHDATGSEVLRFKGA
jgi:heat shock protein HslJ/predicted secreted protein